MSDIQDEAYTEAMLEIVNLRAKLSIAQKEIRLAHNIRVDFDGLLNTALAINDQLRINVDHVEYEGSMNLAEAFRELVNSMSAKYQLGRSQP